MSLDIGSGGGTFGALMGTPGPAGEPGANGADGAPGQALSAANFATLTAVDVSALPEGALAWVESVRDLFALRTSALALVDAVCIESSDAARRWERLCIAHSSWNRVIDWGIDPAAGNDEHEGTAASPLKTCDELQRRLGMWGRLPLSCVITVLSDFPNNVSFRLFVTGVESDGTDLSNLSVKGTPTVLYSGALTTYTALSRAGAGSRNTITTSDGTNWSAYVDKLVRLTSGPGSGYFAFVQTGGVNTATLTPWCLAHTVDTTSPAIPATLQPAGIAATHTFEVCELTSLGGTPLLCVQGGGSRAPASGRSGVTGVTLRWLKNTAHSETAYINPSGLVKTTHAMRCYVMGCDFQVTYEGGPVYSMGSLVGGGIASSGLASGTFIRFQGGGTRARAALASALNIGGGMWMFDGDFCFTFPLFVGAASSQTSAFPAAARLANVYFNLTGDGVRVGKHACVEVATGEYGSGAVYGSATLYGVRVDAGGKLFYAAKPTINNGVGAGRETIVGGTDCLWAAIPYIEAANLAAIAVGA